jgi:hypothetical protein
MVSLRAEPDETRSLGHARIVLQGLGSPPADASFCIRREGYPKPNLAPSGWQVREERLTPTQLLQEGGDTVLIVGPAITCHLEPAPFIFLLPSTGLELPLFWPHTIDVFDATCRRRTRRPILPSHQCCRAAVRQLSQPRQPAPGTDPRRPLCPLAPSGCTASCMDHSGQVHRPGARRPQHVNDAADHPPVIDVRHSTWLVRQERCQALPFFGPSARTLRSLRTRSQP